MQRILPFIGLILVFSCSPENSSDNLITIIENTNTMEETSASNTPEGPGFEPRNKETILTYFQSLITNKQIIVGQQCGDAPNSTRSYYNTYVDQLADKTGRHVGLIGADFGWFSGDNYPVQTLIDHWRDGGLVTVSWHADNPFVDKVDVYWDTVEDKDQIHLKTLLKGEPQTKAWTSYRTELDKV